MIISTRFIPKFNSNDLTLEHLQYEEAIVYKISYFLGEYDSTRYLLGMSMTGPDTHWANT